MYFECRCDVLEGIQGIDLFLIVSFLSTTLFLQEKIYSMIIVDKLSIKQEPFKFWLAVK